MSIVKFFEENAWEILVFVGAVIVAYKEMKKAISKCVSFPYFQRKNFNFFINCYRRNRHDSWIFLGALVVAVGTLISAVDDSEKLNRTAANTEASLVYDSQNAKKADTIKIQQHILNKKQDTINAQQYLLSQKQDRIEQLQNTNFKLSQVISDSAISIRDYQTGKGTYYYVNLLNAQQSNNMIKKDTGYFYLFSIGKAPLFNLNIRILSWNDYLKQGLGQPHENEVNQYASYAIYSPRQYYSGRIVDGTRPFIMNHNETIKFEVDFEAGLKNFQQLTIMKFDNSSWQWSGGTYLQDFTSDYDTLFFWSGFPDISKSEFKKEFYNN